MRVDIVTLFPELFVPHLSSSLLGKAVASGTLSVELHDLRAHGIGKHRSVDDEPYGGGAGMVMRPEPIFAAVEPLLSSGSHVVLLSPRGKRLVQPEVVRLARLEHLILICGRYEGVDERVITGLQAEELSIGDFVLAGGELPALVVLEAVSRYVPGVLGNPASLGSESHAEGLLEYPQYTRPQEFRGMKVPDVLLSGHHADVAEWRAEQARRLTEERRPDLLPRPAEGGDI
ncbi:MAG: tRNA (guanosine(37)-N1)-methyltransferase TrmD [Actinomycetota bacterium]